MELEGVHHREDLHRKKDLNRLQWRLGPCNVVCG